MTDRIYIAIDLKSFYASVECMDRQLDPMTTNLVVADESRTEKTICLAVSPSLKAHKIPGRARLFEVVQRVREVNNERRHRAPGRQFAGKSANSIDLQNNPALELDYVVAVPRMGRYMEVSAKIYSVYLKYVSPDDIHVYSIDEVFIDATSYLKLYKLSAHDFAMKVVRDVLKTTGITATAGIGPNHYLCKIAMDVMAKHIKADKDGVRIAELSEQTYREQLWHHRPLTDFWRVGKGYASKLESAGMYTMGDVARMSVKNEDLLYRMFGVNAELLIDHAWGWEPCTIADIKSYRPESSSISSGQVLQDPYEYEKAKLVVLEMTDLMALDLVAKRLVTDQLVLNIAYDVLNISDPERRTRYCGPIKTDNYGRQAPKDAHGSTNLGRHTSSARIITDHTMELFDRITDPELLVRKITIGANHVLRESDAPAEAPQEQPDLFTDYEALEREKQAENAELEKERRLQEALLSIKKQFGKNSILKAMNLQEGATAKNLDYHHLKLSTIYQRALFVRLCQRANLRDDFEFAEEDRLRKGLLRICHLNSTYQLKTLLELLQAPAGRLAALTEDEERILTMFHFSMWGRNTDIKTVQESVAKLKENQFFFSELLDVLNYLFEHADLVTAKPELPFDCPLELHANYTRDEILAALGNWTMGKSPEMREGVKYLPEINTDIFLVTLNKSEKHYSPTTMYLDYAISDELFHWQSQSTTSTESATGKRYLNGSSTILLFVRENKNTDGISSSYCFLGPAKYVSHSGSKPINITWKLLYTRLCRMTERMAIA